MNSNFNICSLKINQLLTQDSHTIEEFNALGMEFLIMFTKDLLTENNTFFLKIIQAHLLFRLDSKVLALHSIIELPKEKITFYEEYMIYEFSMTHKIAKESDLSLGNEEVVS